MHWIVQYNELYIENYRGTAHAFCNVRYSNINKNPVALHSTEHLVMVLSLSEKVRKRVRSLV